MSEELCNLVEDYIKDEKKGEREYRRFMEKLEERGEAEFAAGVQTLAEDELKHRTFLWQIHDKLCR